MDLDGYCVIAKQVTTDWFGTRTFYRPMYWGVLDQRYHCLKDDDEMPSVWGYDTEEEAWGVVYYCAMQDACDEYGDRYVHYDRDREDFHSDG